MKSDKKKEIVEELLDYHCPRYSELPNIPLYKDQVIVYIEEALSALNINKDEMLLTPTMLNNYVKNKVLQPPVNKKYDRNHLSYLIVLCVFKQVFSISEISELIKVQIGTYDVEEAYDYFCIELEKTIKFVFASNGGSEQSSAQKVTRESELVRSAVLSVVNKIYIQYYLKERTLKQELY